MSRIANSFGIDAASVTQVGGGFSEAAVFRVQSSDDRVFAVRKMPAAAALSESRLLALHRLLRDVSRRGVTAVPVPMQPVRSRLIDWHEPAEIQAEESWVRVAPDLWQAEPWMPGTSAGQSLADEQLQSAVQCLHGFHESAATAITAISANEWFFLRSDVSPGLLRRRAIAKELSGGYLTTLKAGAATDPDLLFRTLALRVCESLHSWLPWLLTTLTQLSHQRFALQPVVRDLWRAHVLFTGNRVTGLIDFSAAATDHLCLDLARLFRSWFDSDFQRIQHAVELFSLLRPLSQGERKLLAAFDASTVLLSPVTWLRRRFESGDRSPCRDNILMRLTELTETLEQFRPL